MDLKAAIPFLENTQSSAKVGKGSDLLNKCVCQGWIFFPASLNALHQQGGGGDLLFEAFSLWE